MKFLAICDPSRYDRQPLDVPTFYLQLARDRATEFHHIPAPHVFQPATAHTPINVAVADDIVTYEDFLELGEHVHHPITLSELDLVFCRTLKPFPAGYLKQLQQWERFVPFVNSPTGKAQQLQPDFLLKVAPDYIPESIATADISKALAFFEQHQIIVAKQANSCGGRGVFKIEYRDRAFVVDHFSQGERTFTTFAAVMDYIQRAPGEEVILMSYLAGVTAGDKRIVVVDGEIYGAYVRRSQSGHWINNVSGDGECELAEITAGEREAIAATVGYYQRLGLHTLGYDFLQDGQGNWRISEINAGNIGGFARLEILTGQPVMAKFFSWLHEFARRPQHAWRSAAMLKAS